MTTRQNGTRAAAWRGTAAVMALVAAGLAGYGAGTAGNDFTAEAASAAIEPLQAPAAPGGFADIAERVGPAVVSVRVEQAAASAPGPGTGIPPGHPLERFFRDFGLGPQSGENGSAAPKRVSQGSGFFISADGYVVTNHHVVEGAEDITVALHDGTELKAEIVGTDPKTDLALLKAEDAQTLPFVRFAQEDTLRIGDWVVAVGNPFGLGGTVTAGIVSARGRDIGAGPYDDFIQIDASINRGNSGGPAFDLSGNVVGVNTAIYSPSGGSVGIGFAIPANVASKVVADLKEHGGVRRGWLGVSIQPVTPEIAESLGRESAEGALIADLVAGGPAEAAGLRRGDVILAIEGVPMKEARDVTRRVAAFDPGTEANLTVWRAGETRILDVTLGRFPEEPQRLASANPVPPRGGGGR